MYIVFKNSISGERLGSIKGVDVDSLKTIGKVNVKGVQGEVEDFILHVDNLGVENHIECRVRVIEK